jgi:hypothetical protein
MYKKQGFKFIFIPCTEKAKRHTARWYMDLANVLTWGMENGKWTAFI